MEMKEKINIFSFFVQTVNSVLIISKYLFELGYLVSCKSFLQSFYGIS